MCGSRRYAYSPDRIGYNFLSDVMGVWGGGGGGGCVFILFSKACKFKTSMARVPYNKLFTNQAS